MDISKSETHLDDYFKSGQWVGKSQDPNCKDPKVLYRNLMPKIEVLNIEWIQILSYKKKFKFNSTSALELLKWTYKFKEERVCFQMIIPDYIKQEGISKIKIQANFYKIMVYQIGWFNSESPELYYRESRKAVVSHEITNLLDYDSKPCIREANYRFDSCKEDFIYKVSI